MPEYGLYNEKHDKIQSYDKEGAREELQSRLDQAQSEEQKQREMRNFLTGIRSGAKFQQTGAATQDSLFGNKYQSLMSIEEREKQIKKSGSELNQKENNSKALADSRTKRINKQKTRAASVADKLRLQRSDTDLQLVSRFMTGKAKDDARLLNQYKSGGKDKAAALTEMIKRFLKLDPEDINVSSEKKIAANADKLENLSEKLYAIEMLITFSPDTYNSFSEAFRDRFEAAYAKSKTVITYYRLKKQVMNNEYYKTHLNREICKTVNENDTAEQRLLSELIWQSEGGLAMFLHDSEREIADETTKNLVKALRTSTARGRMQKLGEKLADRKENIRKVGLNAHLDQAMLKERGIDAKGKLNVVGHARNIERIKLTGDPEKDLGSITKIMDQLDTLEAADTFRKKNADSYYLEQSDHQVRLCEAALKARTVLRRIQDDLLFLARLKADGSIDASARSGKTVNSYRTRYKNDLMEYDNLMDLLYYTDKKDFDPGEADEMSEQEFKRVELTEELKQKAKDLLLELAQDNFSDVMIYNRRREIGLYFIKLNGTEEGMIYSDLLNRAKVLYSEKRYLNLKELKKQLKKSKKALNNELEEELEVRENQHVARFGNGKDAEGNDWTFAPIMALRNKVMEKNLDFRDLKDRAGYYMFQHQWLASAYPNNYTEPMDGWQKGLVNIAQATYLKYRKTDYGKENYDRIKNRVNSIPQEFRHMDANTPVFLQRGDADIAPPVEITKYYRDDQKLTVAGHCQELKNILQTEARDAPYLENLRKLTEAIDIYSQTQCAVTDDSMELELASLDTFRSEAESFFLKKGRIDLNDPATRIVSDILGIINSFAHGSLRNEMTDAEYAAALEQTPVFTQRTSLDPQESNVKDLPLFTHRPSINDAKQGMCGDCHFLGAVQAMAGSDPDAVLRMFHDVGDGTVLVRLYIAYDENNNRVDDFKKIQDSNITLRPAYVRVRKDYERDGSFCLDSIWVQLLEKAAAAAGIMHGLSRVEENGEIKNFHYEISAGAPAKNLMHFTGKKMPRESETDYYTKYRLPDELRNRERMRMLLNGIPLYMQKRLWLQIEQDYGLGTGEEDSKQQWLDYISRCLVTEKKDFTKSVDDLFKWANDKSMLSKEDAEALKNKIIQKYQFDPDTYYAMILNNINNENTDIDSGRDREDYVKLLGNLRDGLKEHKSIQELLDMVGVYEDYYQPALTRGENEKIDAFNKRQKETNKVTWRYNKAMMMTNPVDPQDPNHQEKLYSAHHLAVLYDIRKALRTGKALACATNTHVLSIHDTKLYKGRWFILVKDPHNINSFEYTKDKEGKFHSDGHLLGKIPKVWYHNRVRNLDGTMLSATLGTSWWELNDFMHKIGDYVAYP